eukprot:s2152_g7.t1
MEARRAMLSIEDVARPLPLALVWRQQHSLRIAVQALLKLGDPLGQARPGYGKRNTKDILRFMATELFFLAGKQFSLEATNGACEEASQRGTVGFAWAATAKKGQVRDWSTKPASPFMSMKADFGIRYRNCSSWILSSFPQGLRAAAQEWDWITSIKPGNHCYILDL